MPRPGFVLEVDRTTPPLMSWRGSAISLERLPAGRSRAVYPPEPLDPIDDIGGAVHHAIGRPVDHEPLSALLRPGMRLVISFDDTAVPVPAMSAPDVRQRIVEIVLDLAAQAGVDDVCLLVARGLRRRMTDAELRHALGERVVDALGPRGLLVQHDAEDADDLVVIGTTDGGVDVELNARAAGSDLLVEVALHQTPARDAWARTLEGLGGARTLRRLHGPGAATSVADDASAVLARSAPPVFRIAATLSTDVVPRPLAFLGAREWEWSASDRALAAALARVGPHAPRRAARGLATRYTAPLRATGVFAGSVAAVHAAASARAADQHVVEVQGQTDIVTIGIPPISTSSIGSTMNPVLALVTALDGILGAHLGSPVVRTGGVAIVAHPMQPDFHPEHHPSTIDFFEQVLAETTDPTAIATDHEERFAADPWYQRLYRTGYAFHGLHPVLGWYSVQRVARDLGRVIVVGGDPATVRRLGVVPASTMDDAFEIAADVVGRSPSITHLRSIPLPVADVRA